MDKKPESSPTELIKLLFGYEVTQCLYVMAKLNVADHLANGPKNVKELAILCQCETNNLGRVLRVLSCFSIVTTTDKEVIALTPLGEYLRSDHPTSLRDNVLLYGEDLYQAASGLLYSVQTGHISFEHLYGTNHWDYLAQHPEKAAIFNNAMQKGSNLTIQAILDNYDFSPYTTIVDVGGGKGHLLIAILQKYTHLRGTIYDLAHVKTEAEQLISSTQFTQRCQFAMGDFFEHVPAQADLYLLKVILHDWNDEKAKKILRRCCEAAKPTSKLLIIERVILPNIDNTLSYLGDINMMVTLGGKERTAEQYQQILEETGFRFENLYRTNTAFSLIQATVK